ncbi:MAG: CBS domain-containing protein [Pseudomonadota bacterium]
MQLNSFPEIYSLVNGRDLITVEQGVSIRDAAKLMAEKEIGAVIVCDSEGDIVGIFTERDMMNRVVAKDVDPAKAPVGDVMTPNPETIDLDQTIEESMRRMLDSRFLHLPVVDVTEEHAEKVLIGIISARDVLRIMREKVDLGA